MEDFELMSQDESGASMSAGAIARAAAAAAVRGATTPGSTFTQREPLPSPDEPLPVVDEPVAPDLEVAGAEGGEDDFADLPPLPADFEAQDYTALTERGVDLPVRPEDVPEEFRATYASMARAIADLHEASQERIRDAAEAIAQVNDFKERLQSDEGRERILLGMALNNPDIYAKVHEMVERMQEDEGFRSTIARDLDTRIREEALERRERAAAESQLRTKGQAVESRTVRRAQQLGLDAEIAKQLVVNKIYANEAATGKRDISLQEVDDLLVTAARRMGLRRSGKPAAKAPATAAKETQAPKRTVADTRGPAGGEPPARTSESLQTMRPSDMIRNAVRSAGERARQSGL